MSTTLLDGAPPVPGSAAAGLPKDVAASLKLPWLGRCLRARVQVGAGLFFATRLVGLAMCSALAAAAGPGPGDLTMIGGRAYRFPRTVFQDGVVEHGTVATILLQVRWPGVPGRSGPSSTNPLDSLMLLGLSNAGGAPYTEDKLATAERQVIQAAVAEYGKPAFPLHAAPAGPMQGPAPGDGMILVESHQDGRRRADVFVTPSVDEPVEMISCTQADDVFTDPQCDQQSISRGMLLKVSYRRPMVVRWREIDAAVERFFATYEVTR